MICLNSVMDPMTRTILVIGREREGCQRRRMANFHGQNSEIASSDALVNELLERHRQRIFINTDLDGNFPIGCWAYQHVVLRVRDQTVGVSRSHLRRHATPPTSNRLLPEY